MPCTFSFLAVGRRIPIENPAQRSEREISVWSRRRPRREASQGLETAGCKVGFSSVRSDTSLRSRRSLSPLLKTLQRKCLNSDKPIEWTFSTELVLWQQSINLTEFLRTDSVP
jgi:hypothetical protein